MIRGPRNSPLTPLEERDATSQFTPFCEIAMSKLYDLSSDSPVFKTLMAPLEECLINNPKSRACQTMSDMEWLETGVLRVLSEDKSGRAFLQKLFHLGNHVGVGQFFAKLRSERRLTHLQETQARLLDLMEERRRDADPLQKFEELSKYLVFSGDGHYHEHACHDPKIDGSHRPTQHFYCLNYRTLGMNHFALAEIGDGVKKEHDLKACKKKNLKELRQGAGKGIKTLYVWDRAILDDPFGEEIKRGGVYVLTLCKSNLRFDHDKDLEFDSEDPVNEGVLHDQMVRSRTEGSSVRRVSYQCPTDGKVHNFVTNLYKNIRPGVIALLYNMRWEIEKVFDEFKNRLGEKKSWSTHENGKKAQANFLCLTHNLLRIMEDKLESEGAVNKQDPERREKRLSDALDKRSIEMNQVPNLAGLVQRVTQRSTILWRWLKIHLHLPTTLINAVWALRAGYVEFSR